MPDFAGLFTPAGALAFVAGIVVRRIWCILKNKRLDKLDPVNAPHHEVMKATVLAWGVIIAAVIYIGVQAQVTYSATATLVERVSWDQFYGNRERCALTHWLKETTSPPPAVANLHTTDPRYQVWAQQVTRDYMEDLNTINAHRQKTIAHPPHRLAPAESKCEV